MKRLLSLVLSLLLIPSLATCSTPANEPVATDTLEQTATPPADEYERALWYGFATAQDNPDRPTTQKKFAVMLSALIAAYRPEGVSEFETVPLVQKASDDPIYRFHAASLLLYAAETMGCVTLPDGGHTIEEGGHKVDWDAYYTLDWDKAGVDPADFSEISPELTAAWPFGGELDHAGGAIEFAIDRRSRANGQSLLDADQTVYMRNNDVLTFHEAAVAVVRLYESNIKIAALLPENANSATAAEAVLAEAAARRDAILSSKTEVEYTGTAYYLSNTGDDANDGLTPETAWATIARLNKAKQKSGDAIFFKRGDTWRGEPIHTRPGVTYSAYGEGAKPRLIGSPENGADPAKWTLLDGTDNIWVYHRSMLDCGAVVLNESHGALKVLGYWDGTQYLRYLGPDNQTIGDWATLEMQLAQRPFDVKKQLNRDLTFFSEASSNLPHTTSSSLGGTEAKEMLMYTTAGPLYFRCDAGNPGEVYNSIEFIVPAPVIDAMAGNCMADNLYIGYTVGISMNENNVTVQNCEIAWIGGYVVSYGFEDFAGNPRGVLRVGGGLNTGASNVVLRDNYIHEIYEEALGVEAFRGRLESGDGNTENVLISGNLVYHAGSGFCYFNWDNDADPNHMFKNLVFEDNYILSTGLHEWSSNNAACAVGIDGGPNLQEGCAFSNNVFMGSRDSLLFINQLHLDTLPNFAGNRYLQFNGYSFLWLNEAQKRYRPADADAVIGDLLDDPAASHTILYSMKWADLGW